MAVNEPKNVLQPRTFLYSITFCGDGLLVSCPDSKH